MATQRLIVNTVPTFSETFYNGEAPVDADGPVTVAIAGYAGAYTGGTATHGATGTYSFTPAAALTAVDRLTLTWTGTFSGVVQTITTPVEVVGGFYAPLAAIRAADSSLSNTTTFTTAKLAAARANAEEQCERIMGRAFVQRCEVERLRTACNGSVYPKWYGVRTVLAATVDGVVYSASQLTALNLTASRLVGPQHVDLFTTPGALVDIAYVHGDTTVPGELVEAVTQLTRIKVMKPTSSVPDRAERFVADNNARMFMLATATADKTGYPDIDAILWRYRIPAIA